MSTRDVTVNELQPGDVLLSYGHGWLSDAICWIDGGRYSHAGFYDGSKVVEASRAGIAYRDLAQDLETQKYIHVYRYKGDNGEALGKGFAAVDAVAKRYLKSGDKFAYHQLFLLALLAIFRRAPLPLFLRKLLRTALDNAVAELNDVLQNGQQPVTCSELLYRIYFEAGDKHPYGLGIREVIDARKFQQLAAAPANLVSATVNEDADAAVFEMRRHEFADMYLRAKSGGKHTAANPNVQADFVTPRDLETSPNLQEIGRLSATAKSIRRSRGTTRLSVSA